MSLFLSAADFHLAAAELPIFEELRNATLRDTQPEGSLEIEFANALLRAAWTIRRCDLAERALAIELNQDPLLSPDRRLNRIQRTRAQAQREHRVALRELKRLQTSRAILALEQTSPLPAPVDAKPYIAARRRIARTAAKNTAANTAAAKPANTNTPEIAGAANTPAAPANAATTQAA
jgi:hypothetical protein